MVTTGTSMVKCRFICKQADADVVTDHSHLGNEILDCRK
jgi:hypothetical protein